ncbi:MAG: autotransporter-associated beta strand repeat-containing protein, partial [Candidatus Omnitrophica bacterium]|nr:autotransporter-associated beta strand repeat-containing protein [Candidatus Omnitrophota bacterium]
MNNGVDETQTIDANLILTINNTLYLTNNAANGIDALFNVRGDVGTLSGCPGIVLDGSNTDNNTVSGDIAFDAQVRKRSAGKWILSGDNTYNRNTSIEQGILSVASIGDVNGAASNLGIPDTIGRGTINFGKDATTGQLTYTGTGETTDRVINLQGTTGGAIIDQSGTGALVFSSALTATGAGAKTLTLQGSTAGTGELQGAIVDSGGGATSVTKSGTGTWTLSGVSTYTGTTTVNDGTLVATTSASALGAGTLTMDGGTLQLANDTALAFNRNTTVAAACEIDSLRLTAGDGSGITHTLGTLSIGAFTLTVGMGDALTTSGVQGLTFGDGTLTGDAGITVTNTRAGGNGLLTLGAVNSNDATDRAFTITAGGTDDVTVGAIGTAAGTDLKTVTITGNDITIAGIGGAASGVTGATSITAATSGADAGSITLIGTAYNTAGTQSYDAGAAANTITLNEDTAFTTTSDDVTFTGLVDSQGAETNNITVTTVAGNVTFNQDVGSTSPVGTFNIASSNQADLANIIADGNITVTGTNIDLNSTTYTSSNGLITFTGATDLLGATTVTSGGGAGDDITFAGAVDLGGANLLTINAGAAGDAGITGIVSGAGGGLTKEGAGTLTLNGANTYTGATTVNAGILTAGIADQAFGVGSAVTVANGATLDLANNNETIGSLAGAGTVTSTGGASSLIIGGDNTSTSFSGTIDSVGGKIALTKVGTGTLALTTANTYSGDTTITTGTL